MNREALNPEWMRSDNVKRTLKTAQKSCYHVNKMEMAHFVATVQSGGRSGEKDTEGRRVEEGGGGRQSLNSIKGHFRIWSRDKQGQN